MRGRDRVHSTHWSPPSSAGAARRAKGEELGQPRGASTGLAGAVTEPSLPRRRGWRSTCRRPLVAPGEGGGEGGEEPRQHPELLLLLRGVPLREPLVGVAGGVGVGILHGRGAGGSPALEEQPAGGECVGATGPPGAEGVGEGLSGGERTLSEQMGEGVRDQEGQVMWADRASV